MNAPVLLVARDSARRAGYAAALSGYATREASSAEEALSRVAGESMTAVVSETALESPDGGIALCRGVESLRGRGCPVLLIAQDISEREALLGFEAGAEDVFYPPVSGRLLRARIDALVRRADREGLPHQMIDEATMALLGQLAGGIAHDLNNPIAFVLSNLRTLRVYHRDLLRALGGVVLPPELGPVLEDLKPLVEESIAGGARLETIVHGLREYSKTEAAEPVSLDVHDPLEGALTVAGHELRHGVSLERRYRARSRTLGFAVRLRQCFTHLVVSCTRALGPGRDRQILIATDSDEQRVAVGVIAPRGLDPKVVERVWRPFFERHLLVDELSLSLAAAERVARAHGGELGWEPGYEGGPRLGVWLPADNG
jgi:DNA-binding response OmpR family regulator